MNKDQIPSNRIKKKKGGVCLVILITSYLRGLNVAKYIFFKIRSSLYFFSFTSLLAKKNKKHTSLN